jgi:hypothetical protein
MPVDPKRIQELVSELNLKEADRDYLLKLFTDNPDSATAFVGQRERHDAFTRRTQELSQKEKDLEKRANDSVTAYAQQLNEAQERLRRIMEDFQNSEISRTKAETLLRKVKEVYGLSDEDIPKIQDPALTAGKSGGNGSSPSAIDIDKKLSEFKDALIKELSPHFRVLPTISNIQQEIKERHRELTGKRLTQAEMAELMQMSMKDDGPTLEQAWRSKYEIDKLEKQREREEWRKEDRQKWEDEVKARNSEEALRSVRATADGQFKHLSPVFREYKRHEDGTFASKPPDASKPPERVPAVENNVKLSGAERAAKRFIERRQAGIPMGKEEPVGKT